MMNSPLIKPFLTPSLFPRRVCRKPFRGVLALAASGALAYHAHAAAYTFTNSTGDNAYLTAANWSGGVVPNTANGDIATINDGAAVNSVAGPDPVFANGGELEIANGSYTQTSGPAYLQLEGNGTILVDGGTFNQGTSTSGPFNVSGTGNAFNMTAGAANFNRGFNDAVGLTSTLSGGTLTTTGGGTTVNQSLTVSGATAGLGTSLTVNSNATLQLSSGSINTSGNTNFNASSTVTMSGGSFTTSGSMTSNAVLTLSNTMVTAGRFTNDSGSFAMSSGTLTSNGEFDFNNNRNTLSGGTINTTLITGVNGGGTNPDGTKTHVFNISGGSLILSSSNSGGIYGGNSTQYINFTANSAGTMEFLASTNDTVATVQGFINNSVIEYSNTANSPLSDFNIIQDSMGDVFLTSATTSVPEPATALAGWIMAGLALPLAGRRLVRRSVQPIPSVG